MAEVVRGINIKLGADTTELDTGLKGLNKELKNTKTNLNAVSKLTKIDPKNINALRRHQEELSKAIGTSRDQLKLQNEMLKRSETQFGKNSKEYELAERRIFRTTAELKKFEGQVKLTNKRMKALDMSKFNKMENIGKKLAPLTVAISGLTVASVGLAFELEGTEAKFNEVFSGMTDGASEFIVEFQRLSAVTTAEARKLLGSTQDLLVGFGATREEAFEVTKQVANLGGALASFNDIPTERAVNAINSALVGEREALKSLGVVVSQEAVNQEVLRLGLDTSTDSLMRQANAQATLNLITQQSTGAINAFTEENLNTREQLMLALADLKLAEVLRDVASRFNALSVEQKENLIQVVTLIGIMSPLLIVGAKVGKLMTFLKFRFLETGKAGFFAGLGINWMFIGILALVALVAYAISTNDELKDTFMELGKALMDALVPIFNLLVDVLKSLMPIITTLVEILVVILTPIIEVLVMLLKPLAGLFKLLTPLIKNTLLPIKLMAKGLEAVMSVVKKLVEWAQPLMEVLSGIGNFIGRGIGAIGGALGIDMGGSQLATTNNTTVNSGTSNTNLSFTINESNDGQSTADEIDRILGERFD
jgi:hypothetical protein